MQKANGFKAMKTMNKTMMGKKPTPNVVQNVQEFILLLFEMR